MGAREALRAGGVEGSSCFRERNQFFLSRGVFVFVCGNHILSVFPSFSFSLGCILMWKGFPSSPSSGDCDFSQGLLARGAGGKMNKQEKRVIAKQTRNGVGTRERYNALQGRWLRLAGCFRDSTGFFGRELDSSEVRWVWGGCFRGSRGIASFFALGSNKPHTKWSEDVPPKKEKQPG